MELTTNGHNYFSDPAIIETLKNTVAKSLNDHEFMLFGQICAATKLNPLKKEIWAIKTQVGLQIMTGINGYLAIANAHPSYDGMECEVDDDEKPTKASCKVYRKDRKFPSVGVALMKEYAKQTPIWRQMPRVMLTKVAKSIALREAFPQELGGLYTQEEMPPEFSVERVGECVPYEQQEDFVEGRERAQKQLQEHLEAGGEYIIEHGSSLRGRALSQIGLDKAINLAKHLEKHRNELNPLAIKQIEKRLKELRREYKQLKEAQENAQAEAMTYEAQKAEGCSDE